MKMFINHYLPNLSKRMLNNYLFCFFMLFVLNGYAQTQPYYPAEAKNPANQTNVSGTWYYTANKKTICTYDYGTGCIASETSFELWRSKGTALTTNKIATYGYSTDAENSFSAYPDAFKAVGNSLFYIGNRGLYNFTLYRIDNAASTPVELKRFNSDNTIYSVNNYTYNFTAVNSTLFFTADHVDLNSPYKGKELWKSDGTAAGTVLVKDIRPGEASSNPSELRNENGILYFMADDGSGRKLWKSDGTAAGTVPVPPAATCSATGSISREYWANVSGITVANIPLSAAPTSRSTLTRFETTSNAGDNYGQRIRGYVCAPYTGNYTFYIASDDSGELWLSTDENPVNKRKIASVNSVWTYPREWTRHASQKSVSIFLTAGRKYYIEALHKEGVGGDNLAVGWSMPGSTSISVIPGSQLSNFAGQQEVRGKISMEKWNNITGTSLASIPLSSTPSSKGELTSFETASNVGDNYGQRLRGYVHPSVSGSYVFYIASDDNSELYLSTDENASNKRKIASLTGWASSRQWTKSTSQKSVSIFLTAGRKYYIEALHKEGVGGDNLAVGWSLPGSTTINVISGAQLSPFITSTARIASTEEEASKQHVALYPNPFQDKIFLQTEAEDEVSITLVDYLGRSLYKANKASQGRELELDFSGLELKAGIYLLQVQTSDGKKQVLRVVKQ